MLDACSDLLVGPVVFLLPVRESGLSFRLSVRDGQSGALVAAVGDRGGVADGGLGAGLLPSAGAVPVARQRPAEHDNETGNPRR